MNVKLTDKNGCTKNGMHWGPGVTHRVRGPVFELCQEGCLHYYSDPVLAVMMDPIQGNFGPDALMWECKPGRKTITDGTKSGCRTLTTIQQIELPVVTTEQRVRFGILCSLEVPQTDNYVRWANGWMDGTDRSWAATEAWAADAAAYAAIDAAADAAGIDLCAIAQKAMEVRI